MERRENNRRDDCALLEACLGETTPTLNFNPEANRYRDCLIASAAIDVSSNHEISISQKLSVGTFDNDSEHRLSPSISVAEFVIQKFIPDCVVHRRSSARAHFRTVLNHVLPPELVSHALSTVRMRTKRRLSTIAGWPYIHTLQIWEVDARVIQRLALAVLERGYSTQMARQIRNVMSLIMSHAIRTGYYARPNPAISVALPARPKKQAFTLSFTQLANTLRTMVYPERHIALFLTLADLRVTEICALKWKYVNASAGQRLVDGEVIPPKTIAVRNQIYRGEFTKTVGNRRRFVRIPDLLCSVLRELRDSQQSITPDNFVVASRNGTPVHPENIAARRLRSIGRSLEIPWLSWSVFVRTRNLLRSQSGCGLHEQLLGALESPEPSTIPQAQLQEGMDSHEKHNSKIIR